MSFFGNNANSGGQSNNAPTSSAPGSGNLFGSAAPGTSSNLFGPSSPGTPSFSFGNIGGNPSNTSNTSNTTGPSGTSASLFGNSASKPTEQKPLFGGQAAGGNTPTTTASSGSSGPLFGGISSAPASNIFGGAKPAQSTNLFGNNTSAPASTAASTTPTSAVTGAFPAGGLFGKDNKASTPTTTGAPTSQTGGMFGNLGGGSNNLFSGTSSSNTPTINAPSPSVSTPTKTMFPLNSTTPAGAPPTKPTGSFFAGAGTQSSSLFANAQQGQGERKNQSQPGSMFGAAGGSQAASQQTSSASTAPSLFAGAGQTSSQPSNVFGGAKPAESPTPSLFGTNPAVPTQATNAAPAGTPSLFGQQASKPAESSSAKPSLFGGASAMQTAPTGASSLFSGLNKPSSTPATTSAPAAPATTQSTSFFNKPSGPTAPVEPAKPQATSMFSGLGKPASSAAATEPAKPTSSLFGGAATASAAGSTPAAPGTGAATSAATPTLGSTTTTAAPTNSLFGGATKPAAPAASTTLQPPTGASNPLAASTAGPTSSMARLKNKTMDEIITRWATDLSKYQKEFKDQAAQVAQWDRLLVENGERIQKLYLDTFEAEKGSREVERQLVGIESQQEELESWLDRYEGEVDSMFSKQIGHGEQLAGPDQEREKTYKLAEKITERLDDMGRDLTKMIKEINDISGTVSKSNKPDDPLSQIVRVLNGHLSQLQWIDTNAAALQAKVAAAQKERSTIGNHYGGPEQDNVDSFYRSYMGRR
ncbi:Nsp1-like C-terminal region-domain-containing protein [Annulohypoxylon bovei var. microspora]|nr:Nsp1-like C-terminal region-domain-containing protein [Annulohypoxylon bovei var. microspora]